MRRLFVAAAAFSSAAFAAAPTPDKRLAEVVTLVKAELKDPDSAKFRDIKRMDNGNYCGWVNAKNQFGGYTGFAVFYVAVDERKAELLPPDLSEPGLC